MKCNKCGSELPEGFKFCTKCGNKIDNTSQGNNVPVPVPKAKIPFYKNPIFYVIVIAVIAVSAILTVFSVQVIKGITAKPTEVTEVTEQETTEPAKSELKTYEIPPISISVPENWTNNNKNDNHYFYTATGDMMYLSIQKSDMNKYLFGESFFDNFIEGFSSETEEFEPVNEKMIAFIDGERAYNIKAKIKLNGVQSYGNIYAFATDNHICSVIFCTYGDKQSDEFNLYETDIIDSIVIKETAEEETELETTAPETEPETEPEPETEKPTEKPADTMTMSQKNALRSAESYLEYMAFSYSGLIEQLEYEKYSHDDAVYAADNCGADWNEQAVKCAKNYLNTMPFSRDELIEQLEYEGFTHDQAVYGVEQNGY